MLARLVTFVSSLSLVGCGASVENRASSDGGFDAEAPDVAAETHAAIRTCGPGPYVTHRVELRADGKPSAGVKVSIDLCPDVVVETDEAGSAIIGTTTGRAYDLLLRDEPTETFTALGQFGALLPALSGGDRVSGPSFGSQEAGIGVAAFGLGTDGCRNADGVRVSVADHPEATVRYFRDGMDHPAPDPLRESQIAIDGLAPDLVVSVVGEKDGCRVLTNPGPAETGKTKTHRGFVSFVWMNVVDRGDGG